MFAVLIFAIVLLLAFCRAERMMEVTFGDTAVDIVSERYSMNIPYEMVESVEVAPYFEDDEDIDGKEDITMRTGLWKNEVWGEYYACMDLQTDNCVLVHLNDGRLFVFSYKSDETNIQACETLLSHLNP